jgi:hypothetical protein
MSPENRAALERYRGHYDAWVNDKCLYSLDGGENEILRVIREEWDPTYKADLWCGSCRAKMVVFAFQMMDNENIKSTE